MHNYILEPTLHPSNTPRHKIPTHNISLFTFILVLFKALISKYLHSMFEQLPQTYLHRQLKTSQARFTRLSRINFNQSRSKDQSAQNFPTVNRGEALDNSKQNLYYETHLTKVRSACKLDQVTIVSKYLGSIRKNFDDMSKVSRSELNSVKLKKREIELMKRKNQVYFESRNDLEAKISAKEKETNEIRSKEDDAKMQTKILENIIMRMKKDQIFYKQYGRIKDEQLKQKAKDIKLLDQNLIHEDEKLQKLSSSLESCRSLYFKNKEMRQKKYQDYSQKIDQVRQRDKFIQERKERTYELQSIELNDTLDEKNIHMREIILAHRVADCMLQSKVSTLIKKYSDIQGAFHLVKVKTGINEPQLLNSKFFSYEQTAQSLLESISENEAYIQNLMQKRQRLMSQFRSLNEEKLSISQKQIGLSRGNNLYTKDKVLQQVNRSQLLADQIINWTERHLKQFKYEYSPKKASLAEKFKILCQSLQSQMKKYQQMEIKTKKIQTLGVRLKKVVKEASAQELSIRLRQTQDMNQSNLIQEEFIQTSRQNVSKKKFNIKHLKKESNN